MSSFQEHLDKDIDSVFMVEFSQSAIFSSGGIIKTITIQFFEDSLDKMGTVYHHAWCANSVIPDIKKNDTLEIKGIVYGIIDFSPDEFQSGLNIFLQEV